MPFKAKINVSRINKERLFEGKNGKYLDLVFFDKPDSYGNDGFVCEDVSKEEREQGVKGAILGNWRVIGAKKEQQAKPTAPRPSKSAPPPFDDDEDDDIPF